MNNIAIIPARGGSKRIPRKNIREFLGKPIIAYPIHIALESQLFQEVMVSTDDEEVANIAQKFGAKIPFLRSDLNSGDHSILNDVISEVLSNYKAINKEFDYCCLLLPTSPFITNKLVVDAYHLLLKSNFDTVLPIVKYSYPVQRSYRIHSDNAVSFFYPEYYGYRTQDLEPTFHDAGMFYWFKPSTLLSKKNRGGIIISELHCHDIDSNEDWELAELKYKLFVERGNKPSI